MPYTHRRVCRASCHSKAVLDVLTIQTNRWSIFFLLLELGACVLDTIITSLAKEVMFLVALVSLSVCLFVCLWTTLFKKLWTDWDAILWTGPE